VLVSELADVSVLAVLATVLALVLAIVLEAVMLLLRLPQEGSVLVLVHPLVLPAVAQMHAVAGRDSVPPTLQVRSHFIRQIGKYLE
jgi:hypothetical protein